MTANCVRWFREIGLDDLPRVGGKNALLGELYTALADHGIKVPNGFALTPEADRDTLAEAKALPRLHALLGGLDTQDVGALAQAAAESRRIVYDATGGSALQQQIAAAYRQLCEG